MRTTRLDSSVVAAPLATGEQIIVLTRGGILVRLNKNGETLSRKRVWQSGRDAKAWLEELSDGSTLLAQGPQLVHLNPGGGLRAQARVQGDIVSLATTSGTTTTVDAVGRVFRWDHEHPPKFLGRVSRTRAAPAIGETLIYVPEALGIATWNLETLRRLPNVPLQGARVIGAPTAARGDTLWSRAQGNRLLRYASGQLGIISLGNLARSPSTPLAPLVYGKDHVAFVSDGGHLGFWIRGEQQTTTARCRTPAGITVKHAAVVYTCESGTVHALRLTEGQAEVPLEQAKSAP